MKDAMVQLMKWTSGLLGVGISKFSPLIYAMSRMSFLQSMCYGYFTFSALFGVSFLIYGVVVPICLLKGNPVFPKVLILHHKNLISSLVFASESK